MKVTIIQALFDNYSYLLEEGRKGMIVDPGEASPVLKIIKKKKIRIEMILNTHHHPDHVGGNLEIKRETGAKIVGPDSRIRGIDHIVRDEDVLRLGDSRIRVIATPGHTSNGVSFYLPSSRAGEGGVLFSGDTLFSGGCGRLFEGSPEVLWGSLTRVANLPGDTLIYCGHEYTVENYMFASTIEPDNEAVKNALSKARQLRKAGRKTVPSSLEAEKTTNPFLRAVTEDMRRALNMPDADDVEVFAELRRRKDAF